MSPTIEGACLCGAVTFQTAPPYRWFAHCHCSLCRKQHGTLFGTGLGVREDRLHWRSGARDVVHYRRSAAFERPFCRHCGSAVPAASHEPGTWHVPAGLLAGDPGARPRAHIFTADRSPLAPITDTLPQHAAYPPGVALESVSPRAPLATSAAAGGSCLCGGVEFELDTAPRTLVDCYCSLCRRSRGTGFSTTLLAAPECLRWVHGEARVRTYALGAPRRYRTSFCGDCGALLPTSFAGTHLTFVPAGAVDTPLPPLPAVHIHVASKTPWCEITDTGPQFPELPPPERCSELFRQRPPSSGGPVTKRCGE